jgi:hypothetical protein
MLTEKRIPLAYVGIAIVLGLLLSCWVFAQTPQPIFLCAPATSMSACQANQVCAVPQNATDLVHVSGQGFVPYNVVSASAPVYACNAQVTSLTAQGIPLFSALTTPPPAVVPPPATPPATPPSSPPVAPPTQSVKVCAAGTTPCAIWDIVPTPQCFTVTGATASQTVCAQ